MSAYKMIKEKMINSILVKNTSSILTYHRRNDQIYIESANLVLGDT